MPETTFLFAVGQLVSFHLGDAKIIGGVTIAAFDDAGEIYLVQWADNDHSERELWLRPNRLETPQVAKEGA